MDIRTSIFDFLRIKHLTQVGDFSPSVDSGDPEDHYNAAVIAKKHVYHNVNKVENQCKCLCNLNLIDIVIYVFLRYNGRMSQIKFFLSWTSQYNLMYFPNLVLKSKNRQNSNFSKNRKFLKFYHWVAPKKIMLIISNFN